MSIGEKIKSNREKKNLSKLELAALVNTSEKGIDYIETHDEAPNPREVDEIAKALGISVGDLVDGEYMPEFALETVGYLLMYQRDLDPSNEYYADNVKSLSQAAELLTYTFKGPYYEMVEISECVDTMKGLLGVLNSVSEDQGKKATIYEPVGELAEMILHIRDGREWGEY